MGREKPARPGVSLPIVSRVSYQSPPVLLPPIPFCPAPLHLLGHHPPFSSSQASSPHLAGRSPPCIRRGARDGAGSSPPHLPMPASAGLLSGEPPSPASSRSRSSSPRTSSEARTSGFACHNHARLVFVRSGEAGPWESHGGNPSRISPNPLVSLLSVASGRPARGSPPPSLPFFTRQGRRCSAAVFTAGEQADGFHGAAIVFSLASKAEPTVHNSRSVGRPCRGHGVLTRSLPVRGGRRCLGRFQLCATASNSDSYIAKVNLLPIIPLCSLSLSMHWPVRASRGTCWRPRSREASWGVDVQYSIHEVPAILQIGPWAHSRITRYVIVGLDF
nr:uncharacterized protein LOC127336052 [Lolium perenne]